MKIKLSLALASIFLLLATNISFAQSNQSFLSLQKNFLLTTSAPTTLVENIAIKNLTPKEITLDVSWQGYNLQRQEILTDKFIINHSIDFESLPSENLTIQPFGVANLPINFNLPDTLKAGDYYGTLLINGQNHVEKITFTLRVLGDLKESIEIGAFHDDGKTFSFQAANSGNRTSNLKVTTQISTLFGTKVNQDFEQSLKSGQKITLSKNHTSLLPGFYQVKLENTFGDKKTTQTLLYSFWVRTDFFFISLITLMVAFTIFLILRKTHRNV